MAGDRKVIRVIRSPGVMWYVEYWGDGDCIKKNAKRVMLIHNIKREETTECGEFKS